MHLNQSDFDLYTLWWCKGNPTRVKSVPKGFLSKDIDITFDDLGIRIKNTGSVTTMAGTNKYLIQLNISKRAFRNNNPFQINMGTKYFKTSRERIRIIEKALNRINQKLFYLY